MWSRSINAPDVPKREGTKRGPIALSGLLAISLFAAVLTTSAKGDVIPSCTAPNGVASPSLQIGAPPALLRALTEHVGEVVPPGANFDSTDIVVTGRNRRLIFVWNLGNRWVVATEHGGRGYNDPIFAYDISGDDRSATLVEERIAFPDTVCSTASSLLASESQHQ